VRLTENAPGWFADPDTTRGGYRQMADDGMGGWVDIPNQAWGQLPVLGNDFLPTGEYQTERVFIGMGDVPYATSTAVQGTDSHIWVYVGNEPPVRVNGTSNTFNIQGLEITINSSANVDDKFQINVENNIDNTIEALRNFIDEFNALTRHLNEMHSTPRPRSGGASGTLFDPLTEEQRRAMSEREVEMWEEQARTGLFHRDRDLRNLQNQLREWVQRPITLPGGDTISLAQIGITTGYGVQGSADRRMGLLAITDENALRQALTNRPDMVEGLFTHADSHFETSNNARSAALPNVGIAVRLNHIIENAVGRDGLLTNRVGVAGEVSGVNNQMTNRIRNYDERISTMERWLIRREAHFFRMFSRMEQAMAESHSQMDALFAFGGM